MPAFARMTLPVAALLCATAAVPAQTADHSGHSAMADDPVVGLWQEINDRMHAGMAIDYSGDPDVDFVRGMIAHHEGAVEMARVVIEHGSDPEIRALAEGIVSAQESEIAFMRDWLMENGHD